MGIARIKKGDTVIIISGKDKGRTGKVLKVIPRENRVVVEGINIVKRHQKPTTTDQGGIIEKEAPIHISNVMLLDQKTGKRTRVRIVEKEGKKVRQAVHSDTIFD